MEHSERRRGSPLPRIIGRLFWVGIGVAAILAIRDGLKHSEEDRMGRCLELNKPELYQPCLDSVDPDWRKEIEQSWREDSIRDPAWGDSVKRAWAAESLRRAR